MTRMVYLHCGLHKTGTTAIQYRLAEHRDVLRAHGVLYPASIGHSAHHNAAWQLVGDSRFDVAGTTMEALLAEIQECDGNAVISSEEFETLLDRPDAFLPLSEQLRAGGRSLCIVVCLRDPTSYLESLYLELLKHGYRRPFAEFSTEARARGSVRHAA